MTVMVKTFIIINSVSVSVALSLIHEQIAECNFYMDSIAVGQQCNVQVNKPSVKMDHHNTVKRIERDDEEVCRICCYGYTVQEIG